MAGGEDVASRWVPVALAAAAQHDGTLPGTAAAAAVNYKQNTGLPQWCSPSNGVPGLLPSCATAAAKSPLPSLGAGELPRTAAKAARHTTWNG
jgi:hypothetical protein